MHYAEIVTVKRRRKHNLWLFVCESKALRMKQSYMFWLHPQYYFWLIYFSFRGALKYYIHAYQFAVKDLSQAIAIDPDCKLAYFNRAVCYQEMKHYQRVGFMHF